MAKIIEKLHELVTPSVLGQTQAMQGDATDKTSVLNTLYSLLVARLGDEATATQINTLSIDERNNGDHLLGLLFGGFGATPGVASASDASGLISALAHKFNLPSDTVSSLATLSLPLAVGHLHQLSETQDLHGYLANERTSVLATLPPWLMALVPAGLVGLFTPAATSSVGVTNAPNEVQTHEPAKPAAPEPVYIKDVPPATVPEPKSGFMKALLPIIGLIILGGLAFTMLRACQTNEVPVAAPVSQQTDTQDQAVGNDMAMAQALLPATLSLSTNDTGNGLFSCRASAGAGVAERIKAALSGVFADHDCKLTPDARYGDDLAVEGSLPAVLGLIKGVPNASLTINDKTIHVNAPDAATVDKLVADIKAAVPADFMVEAEPALNVEAVTANAITAANAAIDSLTETSSTDELVNALNLQIINFAVGSSDIPPANQEILNKAANIMKNNQGVALVISGHTDNTGDAAKNEQLSQDRAEAVKAYLVDQGVDEARLSAVGRGASEPVADNGTDQGRFKNRRIEFGAGQ